MFIVLKILKYKTIRNRRNDWKYGNLIHFVGFAVNVVIIRILPVISIIQSYVPDSFSAHFLLGMCETHIQAMIQRKSIALPFPEDVFPMMKSTGQMTDQLR